MGWEIHDAKTAFRQFADEWDRLNARLYDRHPFFDSRVIEPLLDHFGDGGEQLCIHRTDAGIVGALILCSGGFGRWSSFRPAQVQTGAVLLDDACLLETLWTALPGLAWTIELYAVDPRYLPDFSRLPLPRIVLAQARTIGIRQENHDFRSYWQERPKKLQGNLARYFRRAETEIGPTGLAAFVEAADMEACIGRYGALETAGWKGQRGTAISIGNPQGAFYREILHRFALSHQAAVYELHLGAHLASSRLVIANDHLLICLKTAYDESLARFAPGRLLLYRLIEEQFSMPSRKTIEFYTNATSDQKEWATFACTLQNIQIFRGPLYAAAFSVLRAFRRNLRKLRAERPENARLKDEVKDCKRIGNFKDTPYHLGEFASADRLEASAAWFELLESNVFPSDPGIRYYFTAEKQFPAVLLPVRLRAKGPVKSIESLSNYYTSLYAPLLSKDADLLDLNDLLAAADRDHGGAHVMRFAPMDPDTPAYQSLFNALKANDWIPFPFFCFGNWFLTVRGTWQDYLKSRSANLRSSIRRSCKKFAAAGGTLEIVMTPENIEPSIAEFQQVYAASWKKPEPYPDFVPSLIRKLAGMGTLRLGIARLQNRAIAAQLWFIDGNKASIYKVAYDDSFASYAPGTVLAAHLMQHVIDCDHVHEVDYLIGDDSYKQKWMSDRRERWGIIAYNPGTIIGFTLLVKEVLGRVVKTIAARIKLAWPQAGFFRPLREK